MEEELTTIETVDTSPFKHLVMTLGELPTSFVDSMTYYECLAWLVNYIQNSVAPAVNENAEALTELQQYVEHYFDNLDVQQEIDAKLDAMVEDGTFNRIINTTLFNDLNQNVLQNANNIAELQDAQDNNVQKNESNSVTMNMLDTEVREALTGGSTAVVGASSVGISELKNKGITILKLDDLLQANFRIKYKKLDLGEPTTGWYYKDADNGNLVYNDQSYKNYVRDLTKGKIYRIVGLNYSTQFKAMLIGTATGSPVLEQSPSGTEIHSEYSVVTSGYYYTELIFQCDATNLKAFINQITQTGATHAPLIGQTLFGLYEVELVENYSSELPHNTYTTLEPDETLTDFYLQNGQVDRNPYRIYNTSGYTTYLYKLKKGCKYKAIGKQQYKGAGLQIYGENGRFIYASSSQSYANPTPYEYEWTAVDNGFALILTNSSNNGSLLQATVSADGYSLYNKIKGKTIGYIGDSITESRTNSDSVSYNGGAYPKIISDLTGSTYTNYSLGGATLAYKDSGNYRRICRYIPSMSNDLDAVVISGGINDYWQNIPLGTYSESDFTSEVDDTTISGAVESIFRTALTKWLGKPILFVITHKIYGTAFTDNTAGYSFQDVHDRLVALCKKYGIPYYDCYDAGQLNSYIGDMNTYFMTAGSSGTPDYTHPNLSAYEKYYAPQVLDLIVNNMQD